MYKNNINIMYLYICAYFYLYYLIYCVRLLSKSDDIRFKACYIDAFFKYKGEFVFLVGFVVGLILVYLIVCLMLALIFHQLIFQVVDHSLGVLSAIISLQQIQWEW